MMRLVALLVLLAGCHQQSSPTLYTNGWHPCPGKPTGCREWWACTRLGCEWLGDPAGPGPGDTQKEGSFGGYVP